jgi:hypothetical protein
MSYFFNIKGVFMRSLKCLNIYLFLGLLLSLNSNIIKSANRAEEEFAINAPRHQLITAYLSKCDENYQLIQDLVQARKNSCSFKSLAKAFGIGAVAAFAISLSLYIATR